ncbi:histidinol phosphate phosphatase domain-containing protein [Rummeliibacillus sp. SL167]|uniref:histidinol phosphate phosphatase domain-containing protein n=1 Tax=Rummeliibacillus sp. SL167 TaxID=2579792 RepID=UPI0011B3A1B2|nr:histidinol phosphate phosphatase domain-containing protein [Rummeliibacillus sp. SL167]
MPVDFHFHLEEGPYNAKWLEKTMHSLVIMTDNFQLDSKKVSMERGIQLLQLRMTEGAYSEFWFDLYLKRAKQLGLKQVGVVDHLYRFKETRNYFLEHLDVNESSELGQVQKNWLDQVMTENMEAFVAFVESQKKKWKQHGIELKLGIECDYFEGGEQELQSWISKNDWDFVIGSIHYVDGWGFDNPKLQRRFELYDLKELYTRFFQSVIAMIKSNLFDFVAHLDNLKVFNYQIDDEEFMHEWYLKIANALKEHNLATEINAGLKYRYPVKEECPSPTFLHYLVDSNVPITLSSDAHFPQDLGMYVNESAEQLKQLGVHRVATFTKRQRTMFVIKESLCEKLDL